MSKYFSLFQTEAQYQAAKDTLDYPNVSLIDTTGDLHYSTYNGIEVSNANFGDLLICDLQSNSLLNLSEDSYNTTDYPVNEYTPIGICIFDKKSNVGNECVFMSLIPCDYEHPGIADVNWRNSKKIYWGNELDLTSIVPNINSDTHISTKDLNDAMKNVVTADWSGATIENSTKSGNYPAWECCWRFYTTGTSAGDWYMPSYYDISRFSTDYKELFSIINSLRSKNSKCVNPYLSLDYFSGIPSGNQYAGYTQNKLEAGRDVKTWSAKT